MGITPFNLILSDCIQPSDHISFTLGETYIEPKNGHSQKDNSHLPTIDFQVPC